MRIEFEAVFHSARVAVNGQPAGEHLGKGYTAFRFDITRLLRFGARNTIEVEVDNAFDANMLPRGRSSDWAHDGGIVRPVKLLVSPPAYIERIAHRRRSGPGAAHGRGFGLRAGAQFRRARISRGRVGYRILDEATGLVVAERANAQAVRLRAGEAATIALPTVSAGRTEALAFRPSPPLHGGGDA